MDNLPELRDIHLPDGVSAFPPAYGWWILLFAVILIPFIVVLLRSIRLKSRKLYALSLIKKINNSSVVSSAVKISELLKRICVYKYPDAVNMFGKQWIEFLNSHTKQRVSAKAEELLINAPYISENSQKYEENQLTELKDYAKKWIGENL